MKNNVNYKIAQSICSGCGVCEIVCPKHCISLVEDTAGFVYPEIDNQSCISCGLCVKKCPNTSLGQTFKIKEVYAACSNNLSLLKSSNSGGIFSQLAIWCLKEKQGLVCGAAFNEKLEVEHIIIDNIKDLFRLQGSKYVQSRNNKVFKTIKTALDAGRFVLFSGTGCQTAGLLCYLDRSYENLITIELVCHGVPSPGLFRKYLAWLSSKANAPILEYRFRTKKHRPTGEHSEFFYVCNNKIHFAYSYEDPYYGSFLSGRTLRPSCYQCKYKGMNRSADITLGDFWGVESVMKRFPAKNGISLVMVNTDRGKNVLNKIRSRLSISSSTYEYAKKKNPSIDKATSSPKNKVDYNHPYLFDIELTPKCSLKNKIKNRIPWRLKFLLKRFL